MFSPSVGIKFIRRLSAVSLRTTGSTTACWSSLSGLTSTNGLVLQSLPSRTRKVTGSKKIFDWNLAADQASILNAFQALDDYLEYMIARRRRTLTDDLISELIRGEDDGEKLDHDELLSLAVALLGTGTDTTRHQLPPAWTFSAIIPTNGRCSISSNSFLTRWGKPCATDLSASPGFASPPNTSSWRGSASRPERSCLPTRQPPTATQQHSAIPTDSISPATTWSAR